MESTQQSNLNPAYIQGFVEECYRNGLMEKEAAVALLAVQNAHAAIATATQRTTVEGGALS